MKVNVNTDAVVEYTRKLEKLHKSAFPVAVRQTLNSQAFQTKKKELNEEYNKAFIVRAKGFSKKFSKVKPATGFDLRSMKAEVGMTDRANGGSKVQAGENMQQQQLGGTIGGRTLIPTRFARIGNKNNRPVKKALQIGTLDQINAIRKAPRVRFADGKGKQRFIRTAAYSRIKRKGYMRTESMLFKVSGGSAGKYNYKFRKLNVSITPIYRIKKGRTVRINNPKLFTLKAAQRVNQKADTYFKQHAEKQFKKAGIK